MASAVTDKAIHVTAGILSDADGRVLLAERAAGTHLAGLWEFPGGKIEPGESSDAALRRELHEELGVDIGATEHLISIPWRYPEKTIVLHALRVRDFHGEPHGQQLQRVRWVLPDHARSVPMPPPDVPIVNALRLPPFYAITPEPGEDVGKFLAGIERLLADGVRLIQLRAKHSTRERLRAIAIAARDMARRSGARLLLNGNAQLVRELALDGVHLPATDLMAASTRPLEAPAFVGASCHNERELARAIAIDVDFAVLGPVRTTASHPGAPELGWSRFSKLCAAAPFPVYALGGLRRDDLVPARQAGAHGLAGISSFWGAN